MARKPSITFNQILMVAVPGNIRALEITASIASSLAVSYPESGRLFRCIEERAIRQFCGILGYVWCSGHARAAADSVNKRKPEEARLAAD